jgi:glycosyltransferase involved in cell wall biosynthesis
LLSRHSVEIVHANEPHALTAAWLARAHCRAPLIASRRVIFPLSQDTISLARYRATARIVAVSRHVASAVEASGLPPGQITVISDGVPIPKVRSAEEREAARRSLGIEPQALIVGCVAALTPDKGQEILIRALPAIRVRFPRCQLLLAGDGPCRGKLATLVREHGLDDAVHFAGFVEDIDALYTAFDLFAFPAQAEALGTALLSAMAHGLPVAAIARGGISEAVEDGKNGLLVKDLDSESFASAIARLIEHPDEATRLGSAARETILARFSADRMVEETLRLYEHLLIANSSLNSHGRT